MGEGGRNIAHTRPWKALVASRNISRLGRTLAINMLAIDALPYLFLKTEFLQLALGIEAQNFWHSRKWGLKFVAFVQHSPCFLVPVTDRDRLPCPGRTRPLRRHCRGRYGAYKSRTRHNHNKEIADSPAHATCQTHTSLSMRTA